MAVEHATRVAVVPYPAPPSIVLPHPWIIGEQRLRMPEPKDVAAITAACQTLDIQRFTRMPVPYTTADAEHFLAMARDDLADSSGIHLLITDPPGEALHGVCGLDIDWRDACAEVGYWLHPNSRGRGIASRAVGELCRFAFGLGIRRIGLQAAAANVGSQAIARRLGFTEEGRFRSAGTDGAAGDRSAPRTDMVQFGLLPGELGVA